MGERAEMIVGILTAVAIFLFIWAVTAPAKVTEDEKDAMDK